MIPLDETHDPARKSWVPNTETHSDFPIQNLPFGIFSPPGGIARPGIAIGNHILDVRAIRHGLEADAERALAQAEGQGLNAFLALGAPARIAVRRAISRLLAHGNQTAEVEAALHEAAACALHLPAAIGDYTDFYAGIHHATAVGKLFRPDNPLLPNYKYVPIGYHGRASSVRASGIPFRRPNGQRKPPDATEPLFGPAERLDYELELGIWIGPGNQPGDPIPIDRAADHIAGYCLLNDWSARDIQAWEYQPLGPFLAKSFATTISPWIVTPEALAPFRTAQPSRPSGDPTPLPYLANEADQQNGALRLRLTVSLRTARMAAENLPPHRLSRSNAADLYWTPAQLVAHHASNGCDLRPGDLIGTGTISGPNPEEAGSLLELTAGGRTPIELPNREQRRFLQDGDEITIQARAEAPGAVPIGFGDCTAALLPA